MKSDQKPGKLRWWGWTFLALVVVLLVAGYVLPYDQWIANGQQGLTELKDWCVDHLLYGIGCFALFYVVFTGLSLPGALFLTIFGGWVFGTAIAFPTVNIAATAGATLAFLSSRYLFRKRFSEHYSSLFQKVDNEFHRLGWVYLLALRLNPLFPFFLENILFGLTRMPVWQFWVVTQIGMIPLGFLYASAGAQLARITSLRGLLDGTTLLILFSLSLAPFLGRFFFRVLVNSNSK